MGLPVEHRGDPRGMGGEEQRRSGLGHEIEKQGHDRVGRRFVEAAGGFVSKEERGAQRQRAADGDALLLAAGEVFRVARQVPGEAEDVGEALGPVGVLAACEAGMEREVLGHRQGRDEVELLEDERQTVAAQVGPGPVGEGGIAGAVERDLSAVEGVEGGGEVEKGALAAAAFTRQRKAFAAVERECHAVENGVVGAGIGLCQIGEREEHVRVRKGFWPMKHPRGRRECPWGVRALVVPRGAPLDPGGMIAYEGTTRGTGSGMDLWEQIFWGSVVLVACIIFHVIGIGATTALLDRIAKDQDHPRRTGTLLLLVAVAAVTFLHVVEIWFWAAALMGDRLFQSLADSIYFSLATYTTVGYGDVVVGPGARGFAAFGSMTGMLTFGISTAFLVAYFNRLIGRGGPNWS